MPNVVMLAFSHPADGPRDSGAHGRQRAWGPAQDLPANDDVQRGHSEFGRVFKKKMSHAQSCARLVY